MPINNYTNFWKNLTEEEPAPAAPNTRAKILAKAEACVNGHREQDYGTPEDNFATIAKYWSIYLGREVTALDVSHMMILFKVARLMSGNPTMDSYVDIAGYAACGGEIANKEE